MLTQSVMVHILLHRRVGRTSAEEGGGDAKGVFARSALHLERLGGILQSELSKLAWIERAEGPVSFEGLESLEEFLGEVIGPQLTTRSRLGFWGRGSNPTVGQRTIQLALFDPDCRR